MPQVSNLMQALKQSLKAHGFTYAQVGQKLDLSEASVKRLFSQENLSLARFEQICQLMELEISDLVQLMHDKQPRLQQLSIEQELEITQDLTLLLVTVCVLNRWTMEDLMSTYKLSDTDCIQKLARLDKLKIIELLPKNKIKLLVAPNFTWRESGPIQQFFQQKIAQEIFATEFTRDDECLLVLNGMLSSQSNAEFQRKLKKLARDFDELNNQDVPLNFDQKNGVTLVLAMRNWRYGLFAPLLRK